MIFSKYRKYQHFDQNLGFFDRKINFSDGRINFDSDTEMCAFDTEIIAFDTSRCFLYRRQQDFIAGRYFCIAGTTISSQAQGGVF